MLGNEGHCQSFRSILKTGGRVQVLSFPRYHEILVLRPKKTTINIQYCISLKTLGYSNKHEIPI